MFMKVKRSSAGFTVTEIMAVLTISAILGMIAMPRLGKGRRQKAVSDYARAVASSINLTRLRAVNNRRPYRVEYTPTTIVRQFSTDNGTTWITEQTDVAPNNASLWSASATASPPTGENPSLLFNIRFNADFSIVVNNDPALTNAFFYVAERNATSMTQVQGRQMSVSMVGTGATRVVDNW